jgi:hypothetical protein
VAKLIDAEITTIRTVSRRAALGAAAATLLATGAPAHADAGFNDNDRGPNRDPQYRGRGARPVTGRNDNDRGARADPTERGQGPGVNDGDRGANADPRGAGRAGVALGLNDGDSGPNEDPAGRGRGDRHATGRNDTDRNSQRGGDPPGQGR